MFYKAQVFSIKNSIKLKLKKIHFATYLPSLYKMQERVIIFLQWLPHTNTIENIIPYKAKKAGISPYKNLISDKK